MPSKRFIYKEVAVNYKSLLDAGQRNSIRQEHINIILDLYEKSILRWITRGVYTSLGRFSVVRHQAREVMLRNEDGVYEPFYIPAKNRIKFKMSENTDKVLNRQVPF